MDNSQYTIRYRKYQFPEPCKHLFSTFISEANCVFPNSLQGNWRGLDDNKLTFTADELIGFKLNIPHLSESDFMCIRSFVEGDTTKYILRYGIENTIHICTLFDLTFLFNITSSHSKEDQKFVADLIVRWLDLHLIM